MLTINGFHFIISKFETGVIRIEVAEGQFVIGGAAEFAESDGPVSFDKLAKYARGVGDRMIRICEDKDNTLFFCGCGVTKQLKLVLGRAAEDAVDGGRVFDRVKASIKLDEHLCEEELMVVFMRVTHINSVRKRMERQGRSGMPAGLAELMRMMA
jgi:hypothetical protein